MDKSMRREVLPTNRESEYFSREGLRKLTGLPDGRWRFAVIKELIDNALDAIDGHAMKEVVIEASDQSLTVRDSGGGIDEETLALIYDFAVYASSKRDYRSPTRGLQGNALKTLIGICHIMGWDLTFLTGDKAIHHEISRPKLDAGIVSFQANAQPTSSAPGVRIDGISVDIKELHETVWAYHLANPDVTFRVNQKTYGAVADPVARTNKTHVHWYDLRAFNDLLQKIHTKDPERTVKAFCGIFSGTQRVISSLAFPYKRLSQIHEHANLVSELYRQLKALTQEPRPDILRSHLTGKEVLLHLYGCAESQEYRYKRATGTYGDNEARIPYVLEGFLLYDRTELTRAKVMATVNNSVPYETPPFIFNKPLETTLVEPDFLPDTLKSLLEEAEFFEARGVVLYLNLISPWLRFTDHAKTRIISDGFAEDLLKITDYCCRGVIKEVRKARREQRRFDRERVIREPRKKPKKRIMFDLFMEAFHQSKGNYSLVNVRQIFYTLRGLANIRYGVDLTQTDYQCFTQKVVTQCMKKYPELERCVGFERRGFFLNPFTGQETPISTHDVRLFIQSGENATGRINSTSQKDYDLRPEQMYNAALFIEKQGFIPVLKESGLVRERNLAVMTSQGFATRAARTQMKFFIRKGIKVYVLHDCDIYGHDIVRKIRQGSETFEEPLDVIDIGLSVADIDRLGKRPLAETVKPKGERRLRTALEGLSPQERSFFVIEKRRIYGPSDVQYRRVELNALTNDEFVAFILSKIQHEVVKPDPKDVEGCCESMLDPAAIVKEALHRVLGSKFHCAIDSRRCAERALRAINGKRHWTQAVEDEVARYVEEQIKLVSGLISERYL